jgi:hypothetical protein
MSNLIAAELVDDSPIDIDASCQEFKRAWYATVNSLFTMLELIRSHQSRPGYEKLRDALEGKGIIKRSVMSMLETIIANPVLMEPKHRAQLPPSYNTLWTLTGIKERVLEEKIAKKELTPEVTLEQARRWKRESGKPRSNRGRKAAPIYASLKVESLPKLKINAAKIQKCMDQLQKLGIIVVMSRQFK